MKKSKVVTIVTCIIFIMILAVNLILNSIFYNPFKNSYQKEKVWNLMVESMLPTISYTWLSSNNANTFKYFSFANQYFELYEHSKKNREDSIICNGNIKYYFGKALVDYDIKVSKQLFFTHGDFLSVDADDYLSFESNSYYQIVLSFKKNLTIDEVIENFQNLFDSNSNKKCIRLIAKTSDELNDIALGIAGNNSFFSVENARNSKTPDMLPIWFQNNLFWLSRQQEITSTMMKTGLFGTNSIDFAQREAYIQGRDDIWIGLVAFAKGDVINNLLSETNSAIVAMYPEN